MRLAIVTMVYNEPDMLPLWLQHYVREGDMFVIDHGSDDCSTLLPLRNAERIRIPRSKHDNRRRADFVQDFTASLLRYYDAVLFTDVDELMRVDPAEHRSIADFAVANPQPVVTTIGLNLLHRLHHEPALDLSMPLWGQRSYVFPTASMCKPALIREPVIWSRGFHTYNGLVRFGRLFNFHIAYVDRAMAVKRQAKRRTVEGASYHHKVDDTTVTAWMEGWSKMPLSLTTLDYDCPVMGEFTKAVEYSQIGRERKEFTIDLNLGWSHLWLLPERFRGVEHARAAAE